MVSMSATAVKFIKIFAVYQCHYFNTIIIIIINKIFVSDRPDLSHEGKCSGQTSSY